MSVEFSGGDGHSVIPMPHELHPGARVMIRGNPISTTLRSRTGYVIGPDTLWRDFYIIHLDQPALFHHANGEVEELEEIREGADNLIIVPT